MSTPITTAAAAPLNASQVFDQLADLVANQVFEAAGPVIIAALAKVNADPQTVLNPLNSGIFAAQFVADLTATLPTIENSAVQGAAQLASALLTGLTAKFATAPGSAAAIGSAIAAQVTGS